MGKLYISKTNKNDVIKILGSPSTKSQFNENKWFFIERKVTNSSMIKLGKDKLEANNILILEFDNNGILASKKIYDKKQMQDLKFSENIVTYDYENKSLFFNIMSSVRQKIQAPIKKRIKKDRKNN